MVGIAILYLEVSEGHGKGDVKGEEIQGGREERRYLEESVSSRGTAREKAGSCRDRRPVWLEEPARETMGSCGQTSPDLSGPALSSSQDAHPLCVEQHGGAEEWLGSHHHPRLGLGGSNGEGENGLTQNILEVGDGWLQREQRKKGLQKSLVFVCVLLSGRIELPKTN